MSFSKVYNNKRVIITSRKLFNPISYFWLSTLFLLFSVTPEYVLAESANPPVHVITNSSVEMESLDADMLRAIYTMRMRRWPDGQPIEVFILPDRSPIHIKFCKTVLHLFPFVLRDQWDRLMFTGTGGTPTLAESEADLVKHVGETPGAIGYSMSARRVSVKTIKVTEGMVFGSQFPLSATAIK